MSVLPQPGGPYSSIPRTCFWPILRMISGDTTRDAKARRKMSSNSRLRPPMPSASKLNPFSNRRLPLPELLPVSLSVAAPAALRSCTSVERRNCANFTPPTSKPPAVPAPGLAAPPLPAAGALPSTSRYSKSRTTTLSFSPRKSTGTVCPIFSTWLCSASCRWSTSSGASITTCSGRGEAGSRTSKVARWVAAFWRQLHRRPLTRTAPRADPRQPRITPATSAGNPQRPRPQPACQRHTHICGLAEQVHLQRHGRRRQAHAVRQLKRRHWHGGAHHHVARHALHHSHTDGTRKCAIKAPAHKQLGHENTRSSAVVRVVAEKASGPMFDTASRAPRASLART